MNLNLANQNGAAKWEKEYRFTEAYDLDNVSSSNMQKLSKTLSMDPSLMQKYYLYNSVSYNDGPCDDECQLNHICAIRNLDTEKYEDCLTSTGFSKEASKISIILSFIIFYIMKLQ